MWLLINGDSDIEDWYFATSKPSHTFVSYATVRRGIGWGGERKIGTEREREENSVREALVPNERRERSRRDEGRMCSSPICFHWSQSTLRPHLLSISHLFTPSFLQLFQLSFSSSSFPARCSWPSSLPTWSSYQPNVHPSVTMNN